MHMHTHTHTQEHTQEHTTGDGYRSSLSCSLLPVCNTYLQASGVYSGRGPFLSVKLEPRTTELFRNFTQESGRRAVESPHGTATKGDGRSLHTPPCTLRTGCGVSVSSNRAAVMRSRTTAAPVACVSLGTCLRESTCSRHDSPPLWGMRARSPGAGYSEAVAVVFFIQTQKLVCTVCIPARRAATQYPRLLTCPGSVFSSSAVVHVGAFMHDASNPPPYLPHTSARADVPAAVCCRELATFDDAGLDVSVESSRLSG